MVGMIRVLILKLVNNSKRYNRLALNYPTLKYSISGDKAYGSLLLVCFVVFFLSLT